MPDETEQAHAVVRETVRVRRAESTGTAAAAAAQDASILLPYGDDEDADDSVDASAERSFLTDIAHALYSAGCPTHELEEALARVARALRLRVMAFCTSSMLTLDFRAHDGMGPRTYTSRPPKGLHMHQMAQLLDLVRAVSSEELPLGEACARLDAIVDAQPLYALGVQLVAALLQGLAPSIVFFGGGLRDAAVACGLSLLHGFLELACESSPRLSRLRFFLAGAAAGFAARAANASGITSCTLSVALSGIIVALPGLPFTVALSEVVYGSVTAGTSRFFQASIATLQIGLGLAIGTQLVWFGTPWSITADSCAPTDGVPPWGQALAMLVGFVSLSVSLNAHYRQWLIMMLAAGAALTIALLGRGWGLSAEVSVCW